ncbi:hypothetical protein DCC62_09790, partial [candidate division KSB1 bacterium]
SLAGAWISQRRLLVPANRRRFSGDTQIAARALIAFANLVKHLFKRSPPKYCLTFVVKFYIVATS